MVMSQCSSQVHDSVCTTAAETSAVLIDCFCWVQHAKKVETQASFQVAKLGRNQRFLFVSRHCNSDSISDETISSQRGELWPMKKSSSEGSPGEVAPVCGVDGGMTCSPIFYFVMVISVMESI